MITWLNSAEEGSRVGQGRLGWGSLAQINRGIIGARERRHINSRVIPKLETAITPVICNRRCIGHRIAGPDHHMVIDFVGKAEARADLLPIGVVEWSSEDQSARADCRRPGPEHSVKLPTCDSSLHKAEE